VRVCRALGIAATIWMALVAAWGFAAPLGGGHYGSMGAMGIAAENMLRWHIIGPVTEYVAQAPSPGAYYCHHPWGVFWDLVPLLAIFGHHDWVLWLPAILMSSLLPLLLYRIGEDAWGPVGGAAAACGFAFIPIAVGFANFHSLELVVIFGFALFFWGHGRMMVTRQPRYLAASLTGAAIAACGDWPGYLGLGAMMGWALVRAHIVPSRWTPALPRRLYERWWALTVSLALGLLVLFIALFVRSDKLGEWLGSAGGRASGTTLAGSLAARRHWIELMFTPPIIGMGKVALPLALVRWLVRRRDEEFYSIAVLVAAVVQYVAFPQGADVHIFWPHYFALYYALAFAQFTVTLRDGLRVLARRAPAVMVDPRRGALGGYLPVGAWAATAAWILPVLFVATPSLALVPDDVRTLKYARESGGRYNERGWPTPSSQDTVLVLHRLRERAPQDAVIEAHASMQWRWYHMWAWQGPSRADVPLPSAVTSSARPAYFMARASWLNARDQLRLASTFHIEAYGDIWVIDLRQPHAPIDAFSLDEREPNLWEWYVVGGWQPIRKITPDPYATWDARVHLNQPAQPPMGEPKTLDQKRIAHNMAVSAGDRARAEQLAKEIDAAVDGRGAASFSQGIRFKGVREIRGAEPRVESWFEAAGPVDGDPAWTVHSKLEAPKRWSLIPPDPQEREVSRPCWPPTSLWRPGFFYKRGAVLWHRIGVERYWGFFKSEEAGRSPARLDGAVTTDLITVP
jgi:hypothetical protein